MRTYIFLTPMRIQLLTFSKRLFHFRRIRESPSDRDLSDYPAASPQPAIIRTVNTLKNVLPDVAVYYNL